MDVTMTSILTGKTQVLTIPKLSQLDYINWAAMPRVSRPYVQDAFPYLSDDEREFLISGITQNEWDTLIPPEED